MNLIKLFLCLIIFFSTTVSAEFYKYVDENGNTFFTDDFNKVPEDQRAGLKGYEESEIDSDTDTVEKKVVKETKVQDDNKNQEDLEAFHARLNKTRLQLKQEIQDIKNEKEQLKNDRKKATTEADVIKINERTIIINKKQKAIEKKVETFEIERKKYRERLEEAETKKE
jgi:uncharacterized protein DUF4124